jgi:oxygen-independent coproporphyrinogen-3 oxidase
MFTGTQKVLSTAGYGHYEISNYARPGYRCRHNLTYWRGGNYLGVGAGAHSYLCTPNAGASARWGRRWSNETAPNVYLDSVEQRNHARAHVEDLDARRARGEFVFLGLRCLDGFGAEDFRLRFGAEMLALFPHARDLCDGGLLQCSGDRWKLTAQGLLLADSVFATFL